MRKFFVTAVLLTLVCSLAFAAETKLLRYPDLHKDKIVFVYGENLWLVSSEGGVARQLTTHPGSEILPKFSPDGRYIAFTGNYDGNSDLYVMPATGGVPKRLTFHPGNDLIVDWYPDSKHVMFRAIRESHSYRFNRYFKVSIDGGAPEVLELPEGELASLSADGKKLAYNRLGREFRTWKRYRGGTTPDVWVYDFDAKTLDKIADSDANDQFPMWMGDDIYFLSDRDELKKGNLYKYDSATKEVTKVTDFKEYDVMWPSAGPDAVIFENGGELFIQKASGGEPQKVTVELYSDNLYARPKLEKVAGYIHSYEISPTGQRAVFEARGDIFTVPAEKGEIRNITNSQGIRERYPVWSPDGKWIAYASDRTGEFQITIRPADGTGEEQQITSDFKTYMQNLHWSPDSKMIMFSDLTNTMYYVDIESKELTKIFHDDFNGTGNYVDARWSPDSKWITYSKNCENYFSSIFLYNLETGEHHQVTSDLYQDSDPAFDPDGKYLYWVASREFNFHISSFEWNYAFYNPSNVVVVTLAKDTESPFAPESDEEPVKEEEKAEKEGDADKNKDEEKTDKKEDAEIEDKGITIDLAGLEERIINLPLEDGNYFGVLPVKGGVIYVYNKLGDNTAKVGYYDLKKREAKSVLPAITGAALSFDGNKMLYRMGNNYGIVDAKPGQKPGSGTLNLSNLEMVVDFQAEYKQIYNEAWRMARDYFYDRNHHGQDWDVIKERYGKLLPYVSHRSALNYLIGEMLAELGSSHTYRGGGDYPEYQRVGTGALAADFVADGDFYKISKIYKGENWNPARRGPLSQPGLKVKEGDYLIAINGKSVKAGENIYKYLVNTVGKTITLKVNSEAKVDGAWEIQVTPVRNDGTHRYINWVMENIEKVSKATDGKVGYIHVPDTAFGGMEWFNRLFLAQLTKEGLIVDARWNSGGFIPDFFLERLTRKLLNIWYTPYTNGFRTPPSGHYGPKVCLTNAYAGSGGDAFPYYFQEHKIGPVIGMKTWGGLIGISGYPPLMDNGGVTVSDFAFVNADGEWDVENKGITPDIVLDNNPLEVMKGRDPQLERGIEEVLKMMKEQGKVVPGQPTKFDIR